MFGDWINQKYRKMCLSTIEKYYSGRPELRAERREGREYYSVWGIGDVLLEAVVTDRGADNEIRIYEYRAAK